MTTQALLDVRYAKDACYFRLHPKPWIDSSRGARILYDAVCDLWIWSVGELACRRAKEVEEMKRLKTYLTALAWAAAMTAAFVVVILMAKACQGIDEMQRADEAAFRARKESNPDAIACRARGGIPVFGNGWSVAVTDVADCRPLPPAVPR